MSLRDSISPFDQIDASSKQGSIEPREFIVTKPSTAQAIPFHEPSDTWPDLCERCHYGQPCRVDNQNRKVCARCFNTTTSTIKTHTGERRNSKCQCNSGKKYKHCCGRAKTH